MSAQEKVEVYVDPSGKWRWRHWRGSRVVGSSSQGYSTKQWAKANLEMTFRADWVVLAQDKKHPSRRMHQTGELRAWDREHAIPFEVVPWPEEKS